EDERQVWELRSEGSDIVEGQVDWRDAVMGVALGDQDVGASGELAQAGAEGGVAGVADRPAVDLNEVAKALQLGVVIDADGPELDTTGCLRLLVHVDVVQCEE